MNHNDPAYRRRLTQAALTYAARGWHVFPVRPGSKKPATPDHPAHDCTGTDPRCTDGHTGWEQRATVDPGRIARAWRQRPYGIGIACGPSGLLVVDLDTTATGGPSGAESWAQLIAEQPPTPTYAVATPSGGQHLYYQRPAGQEIGNSNARLAPRIDTRGIGGYVVAPPTRIDGRPYTVTADINEAKAPAWLVDQLRFDDSPAPDRPPHAPVIPADLAAGSERIDRYVTAAIDGEARRLQQATAEGTRNHSLFLASIALGQLVGARLLDQDIAERVLWANTTHHLAAGAYTRSQAAATIASGLHRGCHEPRRLPADLTYNQPARQDPQAAGATS